MPLLLDVPYKEKDQAKKLGAVWNPEIKCWYVKSNDDYPKFRKWISRSPYFDIICDYVYIIEGYRKCYKCGKKTRVIGYGIGDYVDFNPLTAYWRAGNVDECGIHIVPHLNPIPEILLDYLSGKYNYRPRYSYTTKNVYWANGCDHCNALQGDYFLFDEIDSPFFIDGPKAASELTVYQIPLEWDLVVEPFEIAMGSNDNLIQKYAEIIELCLL